MHFDPARLFRWAFPMLLQGMHQYANTPTTGSWRLQCRRHPAGNPAVQGRSAIQGVLFNLGVSTAKLGDNQVFYVLCARKQGCAEEVGHDGAPT